MKTLQHSWFSCIILCCIIILYNFMYNFLLVFVCFQSSMPLAKTHWGNCQPVSEVCWDWTLQFTINQHHLILSCTTCSPDIQVLIVIGIIIFLLPMVLIIPQTLRNYTNRLCYQTGVNSLRHRWLVLKCPPWQWHWISDCTLLLMLLFFYCPKVLHSPGDLGINI